MGALPKKPHLNKQTQNPPQVALQFRSAEVLLETSTNILRFHSGLAFGFVLACNSICLVAIAIHLMIKRQPQVVLTMNCKR